MIFEIGRNKRGERGTRRDETRRDETKRGESSAWDRARPREVETNRCEILRRTTKRGVRGERIRLENGSTKYRLAEQRETNSRAKRLCVCVVCYLPRQRKRGKLSRRERCRSIRDYPIVLLHNAFLHAY